MNALRTIRFICTLSVFFLGISNAQWVHTSLDTSAYVYWIVKSGQNLIAGTYSNGLFASTNNGTDWITANNGFTGTDTRALIVSGSNLLAGSIDSGLFLSTNNGLSWTTSNAGLTNMSIWSFALDDTNLYVGTGNGVFLSTNDGTNWTAVGLTGEGSVQSLAIYGTNLFAGTSHGIYLSTNNGTSWSNKRSGDIRSLAVIGTTIFAGLDANGGVLRSTDNGTTWEPKNSGLPSRTILALYVSGPNLFAGGQQDGVFYSTNLGSNWITADAGMESTEVTSFLEDGYTLFAGTERGVWQRPLAEMVTEIHPSSNEQPNEYSLSQNYPNPFNPSTSISYQLPRQNHVTLIIYDLLGREVTTLVQDKKQQGEYTVTWNAENVPSGVYFYKLSAGDFIQTKKMILME